MRLRRLIPLGAPVPALVVGALLMKRHGVGPSVWGLNLAVGAIAIVILALVRENPRDSVSSRRSTLLALLALGLLAMSFADAGIDGVHRWVHLGPVTLYADAIALPIVIIGVGALVGSTTHARWGMLIGVLTAAILVAQPDVAHATALAAAMLVLILHRSERDPALIGGLLAVVGLAAWSWFRADPLAPVPHVEGILRLAREAGAPWLVAAIASLAILPLPFFLRGRGASAPRLLALGAFVVAWVLVPLVRNYPFPLLGFGVSPIIGYAIALGAVRRSQPSHSPEDAAQA